jgi:hypothetical protein
MPAARSGASPIPATLRKRVERIDIIPPQTARTRQGDGTPFGDSSFPELSVA